MNNRERLLIGLSRLSEANSLVGTMQEELKGLGPKITQKQQVGWGSAALDHILSQ